MCASKWLVCILLLVPGIESHAQRFQSLNDEFPFARSRCVLQDSYGFIWFGTVDGLVKYDGVSTLIFRNSPADSLSLPGQEIHTIIEESDTTLLLGFQDRGLVRFNRRSYRSEVLPLTDSSNRTSVHYLFKDSKSVVWAGTNNGLYSLNDSEISHYPPDPENSFGLQTAFILTIYEDRYANLWVGTRAGLHQLDRSTGKFTTPKINTTFPNQLIIDIKEDMTGQLWISQREGSNRLFTWDQEKLRFNVESRFIRDGEFRTDFDTDNSLWISSRGRGLFQVTNETETYFDPAQFWQHGFWGQGASDVLIDKYRNIWVLAEEVFVRPGNGKGFKSIEGNNFIIHSVYADDKYIWYCADEPLRRNRTTGEVERFLDGFEMQEMRNPVPLKSQSRIYHFEEWGEDLVMSTTRNIIIWKRDQDRYIDLPTQAGGPLRDFVIDMDNNAWIAVNQSIPMRMHLPGAEQARPESMQAASTTHAVAMSDDGLQWWGTRLQGLFSYDPATELLTQFIPDQRKPESSLSSFTVHDILCHSNGLVWVGTNFGLDIVDPGTSQVRHYALKQDQVNTQITSLLEGEKGSLWIGTKDGLLYVDPAKDSLRRFTKDDGLINTVFTERACFRDRHGVLYFGGDAGIDYFHPSEVGSNSIPPDLYVRSVIVNNQSLTTNQSAQFIQELEFSHKENFIEIELIGLHLASPETVTYAYRLPLQSSEWINIGRNRIISLAPLAPGAYVLEAKSANGDGVWSKPKQLLRITIRPPFWMTSWFIGLVILSTAGIIYLFYRYRVRQIRRTERIKAELNQKIAETEMKALRAQMNPHFLFNSLNSVKMLINKGNSADAKRYLTKYSKLIRQILEYSREKFIRLDEELEMLRLYLDLEQVRFKNFEYTIDIAPGLEADFIEIPPMLLQPFVENAIWHGLMNKPDDPRNLSIIVLQEKSNTVIIIEDNGIGRKQAELLKSRKGSQRESLGLRIGQERIDILKEQYGDGAKMQIIDLEDPTGTRVIISLPVAE